MKALFHRLAGAAALVLFATPLAAQQAGPVESRLEARKVVLAADGKETLVAAEAAKPGDVIEYVATYRNTGKQAVRNLQATLPIPANTEFIPGSPRPASAKASVDARAFADLPLKRSVQRDGKTVEEPVPTREVRYLRWYPGELGADKSVTFTARVRVVDERAASPPAQGATR